MNQLAFVALRLPLAQREIWTRLGDRFSGRSAEFSTSDCLAIAGVAVAAVVFVCGLNWLQQWQSGRRTSNQPRQLFADLCATHKLSWRQRRALRRLALAYGFEASTQIFVCPDVFADMHVAAEAGVSPAVLAELKARLFAGLEKSVPLKCATTADKVDSSAVPIVASPAAPSPASQVTA